MLPARMPCFLTFQAVLAAVSHMAAWQQPLYVLYCRLPTPVQVEAVPLILGGGDVMAVCSWQ
jgi:hypothetical protein